MNSSKIKFGTFYGIFIPNVTMMLGVILFLRLGILVGNSGLVYTLSAIFLSLFFMIITSLSIASVASNMNVGAGGIYYLVSRTLGTELGGAIGIGIYLTQLLSICLTTSGFAIIMHDLVPNISISHIELGALFMLTLCSIFSARIAIHIQLLVLVFLAIVLLSIAFGNSENMSVTTQITSYKNLNFWHTFAIFFPAMTGIEAGMALSGNLQNPARSIFKGNIYSLITIAVIYVLVVFFMHFKIPSQSLATDPFVLAEYSVNKPIVYAGIMIAALSSTLGSLIAAPRILGVMSQDGILPKFLSVTHGNSKEPRISLLVTMAFAILVTIYTNIDQIIPMLSMFCLMTYGLMNFIAAINAYMNTVSWRPIYKTHYVISFFGLGIASYCMLKINVNASVTVLILLLFFMYAFSRINIEGRFPDLRDSLLFYITRYSLYKLKRTPDNALTWHPVILVLAVNPSSHRNLAWIANKLASRNGILIFGTVIPSDNLHDERVQSVKSTLENYFVDNDVTALSEVQVSNTANEGFLNYISSYGIGNVNPNIILTPLNSAEEINNDLLQMFQATSMVKKNIALFIGPDEKYKKLFRRSLGYKRNIDIWWDSNAHDSFFLLLNFAFLLTENHLWHRTEVTLKALVPDPAGISEMHEFLAEFTKNSRLKMQIRVEIGNIENREKSIEKLSAQTDLTLIPLIHPTNENYINYLKDMFAHSSHGATILCCCMDNIEHREIYD